MEQLKGGEIPGHWEVRNSYFPQVYLNLKVNILPQTCPVLQILQNPFVHGKSLGTSDLPLLSWLSMQDCLWICEPFYTCSKGWNKLSPSKQSRVCSVEKYNLGSPGHATDKKKSCLLIAIQTEIRSLSAAGACLCVSWNNKTHYLAADQLL